MMYLVPNHRNHDKEMNVIQKSINTEEYNTEEYNTKEYKYKKI